MNTNPKKNTFFVKGGSMLPVLRTGDQVSLREIRREDILVGDIVVFTTADRKRIMHRVIGLNPLQTRGDHCVCDDLPVPPDSPVFKAVSYRRNQGECLLSGGSTGRREFRKHQRMLRVSNLLRNSLTPLLLHNPFRLPARRLTAGVFREKTVYYWGKHPVGWYDRNGWHWRRFARFFFRKPQKNLPD